MNFIFRYTTQRSMINLKHRARFSVDFDYELCIFCRTGELVFSFSRAFSGPCLSPVASREKIAWTLPLFSYYFLGCEL